MTVHVTVGTFPEEEYQVTVETLKGEQLDISVWPGAKILQLKNVIAEKTSVPVCFQRLAISHDEVQDDEYVKVHRYLLIISLQKVQEKLTHEDCRQRQGALKDLSKMGLRRGDAGDDTIAAMIECLEDTVSDAQVRCAVVEALAQLAEKADQQAIAALESCFTDKEASVRCAAVEALAQLAEKTDQHAISCSLKLIRDADAHVRRSATDALAQLAEKGDLCVTLGVSTCLRHSERHIRRDAVLALAKVAEVGDQRSLAAVSRCLEDTDPDVRQAALDALGQIAEKGDQHVIAVVSARLEAADGEEKVVAVKALASAVSGRLADAACDVRRLVVEALVHAAERRNQ